MDELEALRELVERQRETIEEQDRLIQEMLDNQRQTLKETQDIRADLQRMRQLTPKQWWKRII